MAVEPVRRDALIGLEFGQDSPPYGNASLSASPRLAADWLDANEDAWVHDVVVNFADEFDTWWVTLYVDRDREAVRVTEEWQRQKAESAAHLEELGLMRDARR